VGRRNHLYMPSLILDLDGTLLNTSARHKNLFRVAQSKFTALVDSDFDELWIKKRSGVSWSVLLSDRLNESELAEFLKDWRAQIEHPEQLALDVPFPGLSITLASLKEQNYDLILFTLRNEKTNLHEQLDNLKIKSYFDCIVHTSGVSKRATIKGLLAKLTSPPVLLVGDTEEDYEAAKVAQIPFWAVTYGLRSQAFWNKYQPNHVIHSFEDLRLELRNVQAKH
jgi:phosphoglycolate phosphatase-like HAD superfamily hydrolase